MALVDFDAASILQEADDSDKYQAMKSRRQTSVEPLQLISQGLLKEAFKSLAENQCLTEESQKAFQNIAGQDGIHCKLSFLDACLVPKGRFPNASAEKATENFHQAMLKQIGNLMNAFNMSSCDIFFLCLEVFEKLKEQNYGSGRGEAAEESKSITSEEKDILHYIGGSIVASIKRKLLAKSSDQEARELVIDSLTTKKELCEEGSHVSMAALFDRGGLTYVKPGLVVCLMQMEQQFRSVEWSAQEDFRTACLSSSSLLSHFYDVTYSSPASDDAKEYILEEILRLFYKIRVHHKCKMTMDKYRLKNRISTKQKGIRRQLKMAESN